MQRKSLREARKPARAPTPRLKRRSQPSKQNGAPTGIVRAYQVSATLMPSTFSSKGSGARQIEVSLPYLSILRDQVQPFDVHLGKKPKPAPQPPKPIPVKRKQSPATQKRNNEIKRMVRNGIPHSIIAEKLRTTKGAISFAVHIMRKEGELPSVRRKKAESSTASEA